MSAPLNVARSEAEQVSVRLVTDPPAKMEYPALARMYVAIHVGRAVFMSCSRGGQKHRGLGVHGDIDIIPALTPCVWEPEDYDTVLAVGMRPDLVAAVAQDLGVYPDQVEIRNRFQIRDPQIENLGWALKAEMEADYPVGRILRESLGTALAACLLRRHSSLARPVDVARGSFSGRRLKQVLAYVEDNLSRDLSLSELAAVARVSPSHCKLIFRQAMGLPVHQYVVQRRVERARSLLCESDLPISQIALQVGFSHQSHLADHMRRMLGYTPSAVRRSARTTSQRFES